MDIKISSVSPINSIQPAKAAKKDDKAQIAERDYTAELLRQKAQLRNVSRDPSLSASERANKQRQLERKVSELAKQERLQQQEDDQQREDRTQLSDNRTENHIEVAARAKIELENSYDAKAVAEKLNSRDQQNEAVADIAVTHDNEEKQRVDTQSDIDAAASVTQQTTQTASTATNGSTDTGASSQAASTARQAEAVAQSGGVSDDEDSASGFSAQETQDIVSGQITNIVTEQKARVQFTLTEQGEVLRNEIDTDRKRGIDTQAQEKRLEDINLRLRGIPGQQQEDAQQLNIILPGAA